MNIPSTGSHRRRILLTGCALFVFILLACSASMGGPQAPATAPVQATLGSTAASAIPSSAPTVTSTVRSSDSSAPAITPTVGIRSIWRSSRIAFASNRTGRYQIYLMRPDGSSFTQLTDSAGDNRSPVWSQDAKHIFFASTRDGNSEIYLMDSDGKDQVNITKSTGSDWMPLALPNDKLAFLSDRMGRQRVFTMNADGSDTKQYPQTSIDSSSSVVCLAWFQEGELFLTTEESGKRTTRILDTSNGDTWIPEPLSAKLDRSCPSVARTANSDWTMFETDRDGHDEIYGFKGSTDDPDERFTQDDLASRGLSRSADGGWITFYTGPDGNREIYIMYLRSKEQWNITDDAADDIDPAWEP